MLAPALIVIVVLFGGGLLYTLLVSLGYQPLTGSTALSLDAYRTLLFGERYQAQVQSGLLLSLWISVVSTVLSAAIALGIALLVRSTRHGRKLVSFLFQFNLPIPHIVAAIGMLFLLTQSGLLSRMGAQSGLLERPADFPVLIRDRHGLGIIITYVWKEVPFIGVIVLAVLQSLGTDYEQAARTLGASSWQRFRHVTLPLVLPALLSASALVFAFTFSTYEVPELLGVRYPQPLPVLAIRFFNDADLNARAEGMALSILISLVVMIAVGAYLLLRSRPGRALH